MAQITLFGPNGNAVAYIDQEDENTIYLWSGEPVAYIENNNMYGFNVKHLGWYEDGIIWDHGGFRVGFCRDTLPVFAQFEPFKSFKQFKPFKAFKEFAPFKPLKINAISETPLDLFLKKGWIG